MKVLQIHRYKGKSDLLALVDDADFKVVSIYKWHENKQGYLSANINNRCVYIHRFIMNSPKGLVIDHINGNRLDNRRENLRACTVRENVINSRLSKNNTSGFTGISYRKDRKMYRSYIFVNRRQIFLGYHTDLESALKTRKTAEKSYFGEFARA